MTYRVRVAEPEEKLAENLERVGSTHAFGEYFGQVDNKERHPTNDKTLK